MRNVLSHTPQVLLLFEICRQKLQPDTAASDTAC